MILQDQARNFLQKHGYHAVETLPQDASARRYTRVQKGNHTALLMDCRAEQGDRPGMTEFIKIGEWLRGVGVNAPDVYEIDEQQKVLLLEDFGPLSFRAALDQGVPEVELYRLAARVLDHMQEQTPPNFLPKYTDTRVHALRKDLIDLWFPVVRGQDIPPGLTQAYLAVWDEIEQGLPPAPQSFVHMDYHLENLIYMPDEKGIFQCGVIDFQDASVGPSPYDWANILRNVRQNAPMDIQNELLAGKDDVFMDWYRILATQWHGRVLGLFVRLGVHEGRTKYLQHIPRIYGYMQDALEYPVLSPLKRFFGEIGVDFTDVNDFNDSHKKHTGVL